jgi:uncharacterized repeat protein (TIGR03803 family)
MEQPTTAAARAVNDGIGIGCGTIFKVDKSGEETVLYRFTGGMDGGAPQAGLLRTEDGSLYGTAYYGGDLSCNELGFPGCGVVFRLDKAGHETVLYHFTGKSDGAFPLAGLVRDSSGFLYGTTELAGDLKCGGTPPGCGVVFKLDDGGNETVLHSFKGSDGAGASRGTLLLDTPGSLYGTAADGGTGAGVVFKVTP